MGNTQFTVCNFACLFVCHFFVCFFVRLWISQRRKELGAWNFVCVLAYYPDRCSPLLVKFGQGAAPTAPPEAYMQKSPGKNLTWEKTLAARLVGCRGSAGHSELAAVACTEARRGIWNWARGSAALKLGAAALLKAVWWDFRLADGLDFSSPNLRVGDWMSTIVPHTV